MTRSWSIVTIMVIAAMMMSSVHGAPTARVCPQSPPPIAIPNIDTSPPPRIAQALKLFDTFMKNMTASNNLPGVIVQMVYDQTPFFFGGYGRTNWTNPSSPPPTADSIVWIASITKVFTAAMSFQLRDEGIWSMDDPLSKYYPDFQPYPASAAKRPITLRSLAAHTSGLPRENPCGTHCTEQQVLTMLSNQYALWTPNAYPHYSNLGISFLGRAAEKALPGQLWEDLLTNRFLKPIGMTSTGINSWDPDVQARMAVGRDAGHIADILDLGWEAPSGSLYSTARDMGKFMSQFFRTETPRSDTQVLDGATIDEMLQAVSLLRDGHGVYGLPFEFNYLPTAPGGWSGKWTKNKAGMVPGYRSQMALVPDLKLGVFISVFTSDAFNDTTESAYTVQAIEMVGPAIEQTLNEMQAVPPPFPDPQWWFEGIYYANQPSNNNGDAEPNVVSVKVYSEGDQLLIVHSVEGKILRLSAVPGAVIQYMYRATQLNTDDIACHWLADGVNGEMIYFIKDEVTPRMAKVRISSTLWQRVL